MHFMQMDLSKVAVVLLAGGQQTRFLEITDSIPKAMIGIGMRQRPSMEYLVDHLLAAGVGKIVIVAGFLSPMIMDHFFDWDRRGVKVIFDPEGVKIDTGGAFRLALLDLLQSGEIYHQVMYWNPDTLIQLNVQGLYQRHVLSGATSTVVLTTDSSAPNYGAVGVGSDGMITYFDESRMMKSSRILRFDQYAHAGAGMMNCRAVLDLLTTGDFQVRQGFCLFKDVLPALVNLRMAAFVTHGVFLEFGTAKAYRFLQAHPELVEKAFGLSSFPRRRDYGSN